MEPSTRVYARAKDRDRRLVSRPVSLPRRLGGSSRASARARGKREAGGSAPRPARESRVVVVEEDRCNRDIAYRKALSRKPVPTKGLLEIGESRRNDLVHRLVDQRLVGRLVEKLRGEHLLHENPAQDVLGETAIDELFDPERTSE